MSSLVGNKFTEGVHTGYFIVSEPNVGGTGVSRAREVVDIPVGQSLTAGQVLGMITATGEYVTYDPTAGNGSQNVAGIVFDNIDTTTDATEAVVLVRDFEYQLDRLTWKNGMGADLSAPQIVAGVTALKTLGIIGR